MEKVNRLLLVGLACGMLAAPMVAWADDGLLSQASQMVRSGDYDGAIALLKRGSQEEQGKGEFDASVTLFKLYHKLKRYDDAAQLVQQMIARKRDPLYMEWLADSYKAAGNFYSAQRAYEELFQTDPSNDRALYMYGVCLEATGSYDAAREVYQRVIEKKGEYAPDAASRLAKAQGESKVTSIDPDTEIGRWAKSKMPLKIFVADGNGQPGYTPQLRNYVLRAVAEWQQVSRGLITMEYTSEKNKSDISVEFKPSLSMSALGVTYPQGDDNGFLSHCSIYIACNVDSRNRALPPETTSTRSLWESRDRQVREVALHEFGHALGLNHSPRTDDIMANGIYGLSSSEVMSERALQVGDIERICQLYSTPEPAAGTDSKAALMAALQKALAKLQSGDTGATNTAMMVPATMRGGNPYEKSKAIASAPPPPDPHTTAMQQAIFALQGGKNDECIAILKDVLKMNPRNAQAHYIFAVACVNMRNYADAQREYEQVLKLMPTGKLADLASAGLSKIKK